MSNESILLGVLIEETAPLTFNDACKKFRIPEALLEEMIEQGLFQQKQIQQHFSLTSHDVRRLESACRLHKDLDINLPGVALVLDLLEEMEAMRQELNILRKHF